MGKEKNHYEYQVNIEELINVIENISIEKIKSSMVIF